MSAWAAPASGEIMRLDERPLSQTGEMEHTAVAANGCCHAWQLHVRFCRYRFKLKATWFGIQ